MILLISATWVARITGVSHWYLVPGYFLMRVVWEVSRALDEGDGGLADTWGEGSGS
jgi:hypothetical protein